MSVLLRIIPPGAEEAAREALALSDRARSKALKIRRLKAEARKAMLEPSPQELSQAERARLRADFFSHGGKIDRLPDGVAEGTENQRWLLDARFVKRFKKEKENALNYNDEYRRH